MKKLFFCGALLLAAAFTGNSQVIRKNALGVRFSAGDGMGADVSYQRQVFTNNRLEFDLGLREDDDFETVKFVGLFQWVFKIDRGFNFYAGPGIGAGRWHYDRPLPDEYDDDGGFGVLTGVAGIEYVFDIPLQVSFDIRPELHFGDDRDDFDDDHDDLVPDVGLSVRYTF